MLAVMIEQKSIQKDDIKEEPMLAEINWLDLRKSIPETGARYCPIIRFSGEKNNMWSANIRIIENNLIRLKFLAEGQVVCDDLNSFMNGCQHCKKGNPEK
jgi:hypothetical protein